MIAVFLAPVYLLFQYYVLSWGFAWTSSLSPMLDSVWFRIPAAAVYLLLAFSPLFGLLVTKEPFHHALKAIGNFWLGLFLYILLLVLAFDGLRRAAGLFSQSGFWNIRYPSMLPALPKKLAVCGGLISLSILGTGIYGFFHGRKLTIRHDPVVIRKKCAYSSLTVALLADLHLGSNSNNKSLKKLVASVNREQPDLICIAGDLFDNEYSSISHPEAAAEILSQLNSRLGVYACWGNHDVNEKILAGFTFPSKELRQREARFERFLRDADITLLEDEVRLIDEAFYLGGRRDPDMAKKEHVSRLSAGQLLSSLDHELPILLMDHQPKRLSEAQEAGVDLLLSGHTHNGQMFPANLIVRLFWENPWGIRKKGTMTSAVTSGAGVWGPAMRIGTDSEVMILHITFDK